MTYPTATDLFLDDFCLGQVAERRHVIEDAHIVTFAGLTGDYRPLHVDDEFARARASAGALRTGCSPPPSSPASSAWSCPVATAST